MLVRAGVGACPWRVEWIDAALILVPSEMEFSALAVHEVNIRVIEGKLVGIEPSFIFKVVNELVGSHLFAL